MPVPKSRSRVIVETLHPAIDSRFPIKRVAGEQVEVEADVFAEGHDEIGVALLYHRDNAAEWTSVPMKPLGNDRWSARFTVTDLGFWRYTVQGWIDHFKSW